MKVCCICHRDAPDDQATCVACGEASWSAPVAESTPESAPAEEETPKKRGRK